MERWVGDFFTEWIEEAQRLEKERMANQTVLSHPGFGRQSELEESAWLQWFDYVDSLNDDEPVGDVEDDYVAVAGDVEEDED